MAHSHFPAVGAPLALINPATGQTVCAIVMRSEPERGFIIVLDDVSFRTHKLEVQAA